MSNQVQNIQYKALSPVDQIRSDLQKMMPQFQMVLPDNVTPEKFVRVVLTAVQTNSAFLKCDRTSIYSAAIKCASDGLLPNGKEAALIPYGTVCQYQPMVGGIYKNLKVCADLVYPDDHFDFGTSSERGRYLEHKPKLAPGRGKKDTLLAAFAITTAGLFDYEVLSLEEIEHVRNSSKSKTGPAWTEWYGEMAKKTAIKRLAKRLVKTEEAQKVIDSDNEDYELNKRRESSPANRAKADELSDRLALGDFGGTHGEPVSDEPKSDDPSEFENFSGGPAIETTSKRVEDHKVIK